MAGWEAKLKTEAVEAVDTITQLRVSRFLYLCHILLVPQIIILCHLFYLTARLRNSN